MRVEELSNHPQARVRTLEASIADDGVRRAGHLRAVESLRRGNAASRRWWHWGLWWRHRREEAALRARVPRVDPGANRELARYRAGAAAEDRAARELVECFDDEWTLFLGHANRRGEVDLLLVGPAGVWAIEVKGRGVRVHVDGDEWTFEKFDRYGNLVDRVRDAPAVLSARQRSDVERLTRKDHTFHSERRRRRGQTAVGDG